MMRFTLALALVLATTSAARTLQPPPSSSDALEPFVGRWQGDGVILNARATVELEWTPVLDRRFFRIVWTSLRGSPPGVIRFEGHAYYQAVSPQKYRAWWFDSAGLSRPIDAVGAADSLVASWGTPETELGETTYRITGPGRMEVVDRVKGRNGAWREFGRSALTRVPAAD